MKERLAPYKEIMKEPHDIRGTFEECRFRARITELDHIDGDCERRTAKVGIDISNSGLTFSPGDRLMIMPKNNSNEVDKIVRALDLSSLLETCVPLAGGWTEYLQHMTNVYHGNRPAYLTLGELLINGALAPLSKELVVQVNAI